MPIGDRLALIYGVDPAKARAIAESLGTGKARQVAKQEGER
jgi:hypothetical protein